MGLDMYLDGHKYIWNSEKKNEIEDGFRVKEKVLELGYWRKHPNLHGYIVETFAGGVDECQEIELSMEHLKKLLTAVEDDTLPPTSGFFFGVSTPEDREPSIKIIDNAINWLSRTEDGEFRSVVYRASW